LNRLKNAKKSNFIWSFFKDKKIQKIFEKAKNYKFGFKKAKLATLLRRATECICLTFKGYVLHIQTDLAIRL